MKLYRAMKEEQKNNTQPTRRPSPHGGRLRLPFDDRKQDPMDWIYQRRIGLLVTVVALLVFFIVFVSSKIGHEFGRMSDTIYIDMSEMETLEQQLEELKKEQQSKDDFDWRSVQNISSNEGVSNETLEDEKGTDVEALNAAAKAIEAERLANQKAYEKGLRDATTPIYNERVGEGANKRKDVKVKGKVTVSFSFTNPVRYSHHLVKPAYRCEGGGEVVVSVVLNQSGKIVSAQVVKGGDECMRQTAVESALNSTFDINNSAPAKQKGTITYTFIPQ